MCCLLHTENLCSSLLSKNSIDNCKKNFKFKIECKGQTYKTAEIILLCYCYKVLCLSCTVIFTSELIAKRHSLSCRPIHFMDINIIPLVKTKCGDLTDINNYRAIALCNVETKVLEKIILSKVLSYSDHDKYQFGFKRQHSTTLCAGIVKQFIEYYISRGGHVFICFVDFCKAIDKVNYWTLF